MDVLTRLLCDRPRVIEFRDDIGAWWRQFCAEERAAWSPFDRGVVAGFRADRVAGAFAGGYQGALRALAGAPLARGAARPRGDELDDTIVSFCVSEPGGNAPRAIESRLTPRASGGFSLTGRKRWSTMAPVASVLLVAAYDEMDAAGRKRFALARVDATAPGLTIERMAATPFIPEIPHAELRLDDVVVGADALLPGDGYETYVKRFRTVEDVHIHGAVLGYFLGVARRYAFPDTVIERTLSAIVATRALAALDADAAETHVALAGALARDANLLEHADAHWNTVDEAERDRWRRDRKGFGSVAGEIREARRRRAWQRLGKPTVAGPATVGDASSS